MKIKVSLFTILCLTSSMFSFEVNTHQAITRCAISKECKQAGAVNLHNFAMYALLKNKTQKDNQC